VAQEGSSLRLEKWLQAVGFAGGNPFATCEADRESSVLPEFFVDTGYYDLIWGDPEKPQPALVFAPRGGGKTAYRVMVERRSRPVTSNSPVLSISYTSFEQGSTAHVRAILGQGVQAFLDALCRDDAMASRFPVLQRSRLSWFCDQFAPETLTPFAVADRIHSLDDRFYLPWEMFQQSVRAARLREALSHSGLLQNPAIALLADLVDGVREPLPGSYSSAQVFAGFVRMVQSCGLCAVYVLIDRLDEMVETAADPPAIVSILEPLLADLHLMETPGVAFRLFLPDSTLELMRGCPAIRFDRLKVYEIEWREDLLGEMLCKRLLAYSDGRIRSLAQVCSAPLSETIDREIVQWADRSPRRLVRLGELLFRAHVEQGGSESSMLTLRDWEWARKVFSREHRRLLRIEPSSEQVFVGQSRVALAPLEYRFLLALYLARGWCEKERLIAQVWEAEEGVTDQAVSRLVRRIREKIEPDPGDPIYLITEHSRGFRLMNVEWPQETG